MLLNPEVYCSLSELQSSPVPSLLLSHSFTIGRWKHEHRARNLSISTAFKLKVDLVS